MVTSPMTVASPLPALLTPSSPHLGGPSPYYTTKSGRKVLLPFKA
jgi:hypothetical protein